MVELAAVALLTQDGQGGYSMVTPPQGTAADHRPFADPAQLDHVGPKPHQLVDEDGRAGRERGRRRRGGHPDELRQQLGGHDLLEVAGVDHGNEPVVCTGAQDGQLDLFLGEGSGSGRMEHGDLQGLDVDDHSLFSQSVFNSKRNALFDCGSKTYRLPRCMVDSNKTASGSFLHCCLPGILKSNLCLF